MYIVYKQNNLEPALKEVNPYLPKERQGNHTDPNLAGFDVKTSQVFCIGTF